MRIGLAQDPLQLVFCVDHRFERLAHLRRCAAVSGPVVCIHSAFIAQCCGPFFGQSVRLGVLSGHFPTLAFTPFSFILRLLGALSSFPFGGLLLLPFHLSCCLIPGGFLSSGFGLCRRRASGRFLRLSCFLLSPLRLSFPCLLIWIGALYTIPFNNFAACPTLIAW
ncbi:MAG: hypothetical protein DI563_15995 [Variovorax paradoxus]|uniref:Uncharacterized protein n=1 Tax=Variovorax paradoxus TaxID=34073 RepID=A0A2W5QE48_VARPD|nr:MAG: hypothetical protein DI563_15995 [Variovorax paradoxus]